MLRVNNNFFLFSFFLNLVSETKDSFVFGLHVCLFIYLMAIGLFVFGE